MQIRLRRRKKTFLCPKIRFRKFHRVFFFCYFIYFCFCFAFRKVSFGQVYIYPNSKKKRINLFDSLSFDSNFRMTVQFGSGNLNVSMVSICIYQALKTVTFILTMFTEKKIAWIKFNFFFSSYSSLHLLCDRIEYIIWRRRIRKSKNQKNWKFVEFHSQKSSHF